MNPDDELNGQWKRVLTALEMLLPKPVPRIDWETCHAANWRRHSHAGFMEPVGTIETIRLEDLLGIDRQKEDVVRNTRQFLLGLPANNILLWGTRGMGKSSLVRALLPEFARRGLRVIQVDRAWRGRGLGRRLLMHLAGLALERGCKGLEWTVLDWNHRAIQSYYNLGAYVESDRKVYRLPGESLVKLSPRSEPKGRTQK